MMKRKFTMDVVINLTENCYFVTADDVADLCDLREIGFENVRWVKDLFTEFGGCWIAEKDDVEMYEADCNDCKHGGMVVCLSVRVGRMLDEYCKDNVEIRDRERIEDLMYELNAALDNCSWQSLCSSSKDNWNGDNKKKVNRIILLLESLRDIFGEIREKNRLWT